MQSVPIFTTVGSLCGAVNLVRPTVAFLLVAHALASLLAPFMVKRAAQFTRRLFYREWGARTVFIAPITFGNTFSDPAFPAGVQLLIVAKGMGFFKNCQ